MAPKQAEVPLEIQLKRAERKGMDAVLAALEAADGSPLSQYAHQVGHSSFEIRMNAAMLNAVKQNQTQLVLSFLKAGAYVDACNENEQSALYIAVDEGHIEVVKALLKAGANAEYSGEAADIRPLACAAKHDHAEIAKILLKYGADINDGEEPEDSDWLIDYEAAGDQVEITRTFIEAGAYLGYNMHTSWTPLLLAATHGKIKAAALLIEAASDVTDHNFDETVLMLASQGNKDGALEIIRLLLKAGAEVNYQGDYGWTALIIAEAGHSEAVRLLLSAGANVFNVAQSIPARWENPAQKGGNAFDVATDDAVKEMIKSEMNRRIAAALSVLPAMPIDVRQKIIQLSIE